MQVAKEHPEVMAPVQMRVVAKKKPSPTKKKSPVTKGRPFRSKWQKVPKAQPSDCSHWWKIERPEGILSKGVCRKCGEAREFRNSDRELT